MKIKDEKLYMNRIRYIANYRITPAYAILMVACMITAGILMETDEIKYTPLAILIFVFMGFVSIALVIISPYIRKKEIEIEMLRYNFNDTDYESNGIYDFSDEEHIIIFDNNRMQIDDAFYWYKNLQIFIDTSNSLNRIWISLVFLINETDLCQIPLNEKTIKMVKEFNIKLINKDVLDYIIGHKKEAFDKIYKCGHL
jgi:hypothetical protein